MAATAVSILVRRLVLLSLFLIPLLAADAAGQTCAGGGPSQNSVSMRVPRCDAAAPCLEDAPLDFTLVPSNYCAFGVCIGYTIRACDTVEWNFGDGTPLLNLTGSSAGSHVFADPGKYSVVARVSNTSASTTAAATIVVSGKPPSFVTPAQKQITVREDAGTVAVTLLRTGYLGRTSTIQYNGGGPVGVIYNDMVGAAGTIVFAPGEASKTLTMTLANDNVYRGDVQNSVFFYVDDGSCVFTAGFGGDHVDFLIIDDDPAPLASIDDVTVVEGDVRTDAVFTITLSTPLPEEVIFSCEAVPGSAHNGSDYDYGYGFGNARIAAGKLSTIVSVPIIGDNAAEPDKTFTMRIRDVGGPVVRITRDTGTCTIFDDDWQLDPAEARALIGQPSMMLLRIGSHVATRTFTLTSSDPSLLSLPLSVTVPPGAQVVAFELEAHSPGVVKIVAANPAGGAKVSSAQVEIVDAVADVQFTQSVLQLAIGETKPVTLRVLPVPQQAVVLAVASADPQVATVQPSVDVGPPGVVTIPLHGLAAGSTLVTATSPATGATAVLRVDVSALPQAHPRAVRHR